MTCTVGERFGTRQMSDPAGELSRSGLDVCRDIERLTRRPVYYYLDRASTRSHAGGPQRFARVGLRIAARARNCSFFRASSPTRGGGGLSFSCGTGWMSADTSSTCTSRAKLPQVDWQTHHGVSAYRAVLRDELTGILERAGFVTVRWLLPGESGFYQPLALGVAGNKDR